MYHKSILVTSVNFWRCQDYGVKILKENQFRPFYVSGLDFCNENEKEDTCAIILGDQKCEAKHIKLFPNLKAIIRTGTGYDNIDLSYAKKRGIFVARVTDLGAQAVSEFALGLILALCRNIIESHELLVFDRVWERPPGRSLKDLTIGIVGFGAIGQALAKKLLMLETKEILVWNRTYEKISKFKANLGTINKLIPVVELSDLISDSDIVVLCLASTSETRKIINEERLKLMKATAMLVNVGRGDLVDEDILAQFIFDGRIAGVALDVFSKEPPFEQPSFEAIDNARGQRNIILTPHMGTVTENYNKDMSLRVAMNVISLLNGLVADVEVI